MQDYIDRCHKEPERRALYLGKIIGVLSISMMPVISQQFKCSYDSAVV